MKKSKAAKRKQQKRKAHPVRASLSCFLPAFLGGEMYDQVHRADLSLLPVAVAGDGKHVEETRRLVDNTKNTAQKQVNMCIVPDTLKTYCSFLFVFGGCLRDCLLHSLTFFSLLFSFTPHTGCSSNTTNPKMLLRVMHP